jgi:hypothetical protein
MFVAGATHNQISVEKMRIPPKASIIAVFSDHHFRTLNQHIHNQELKLEHPRGKVI